MNPCIAYFSMEIGLSPGLPTYAGGLGMLAGDHIRSAADLGLPLIGVTLLYRRGYFSQQLDDRGVQSEQPARWSPEGVLERLENVVRVRICGRVVNIGAWRYTVKPAAEPARSSCESSIARTMPPPQSVSVILLDTDRNDNQHEDRGITHALYAGDAKHRLAQESVLGVGGVRMLRALGYRDIERFHMNEGHAALLVLELLRERAQEHSRSPTDSDVIDHVRKRCVFTTHTPVPAGHDKFSRELVREVVDPTLFEPFREHPSRELVTDNGLINMTYIGFNASKYINGVAKRHGEISRAMFGDYPINSITNGVHPPTWASPSFAALFDKHIPGWRRDSFMLRYAGVIPRDEIRQAHSNAKRALIERVNAEMLPNGRPRLDTQALTIGFARRATAYKRPTLLLRDLDRLRRIAKDVGRIQLVFAGKAHPHDHEGKRLIESVFASLNELSPDIPGVYLPDYDMRWCQLLVSGCDLWLNTPKPPLEASGTSGMKAAVNGVPSLSVLDGWWIEGCIDGVTGWAIDTPAFDTNQDDNTADAAAADSLYNRLERDILPIYNQHPDNYTDVMRHAIAINAAFFNTQRMVQEYTANAYLP